MRILGLTMLVSLVLLGVFEVRAQDATNQTAENLRAQLQDVQAKETELQLRLTELDWQIKPENIERHFAAVGSTRPEELRALRRRQLQTEKDGIVLQLQHLATSRARLESAIATAETQAFQGTAARSAGVLSHGT